MKGKIPAATRNALREAFYDLLDDMQFEQIRVKDLCQRAGISRVTFYNWYEDKYDLLDDILSQMKQRAEKDFQHYQKTNNPENDPLQAYDNFIDTIFDLQEQEVRFLSHAREEQDPWLSYCYYMFVYNGLKKFMDNYTWALNPRYTTEQTASFLCSGLWGFFGSCRRMHLSEAEIRRQTKELLETILKSDAFRNTRS